MIKTNHKSLKGKVGLIFMTLVMMFSMVTPVYAANNISIAISSSDNAEIQNAILAANTALGKTTPSNQKLELSSESSKTGETAPGVLLEYTSDGKLVFSVDAFKASNKKEVRKAMKGFIDYLKTSTISNDTQNDIMNQIQESDPDVRAIMIPIVFGNMNADMYTALKWLTPLLVVLRVILGIGTTGVIILLFCSTVMDLAYIGLPMWRESNAEKTGKKKPFGVSYEALSTVMEIEKSLGEYKNAYLMYIKRRAMTYVVLAICILYLIVGEIGGLVAWVINLASGVVQ